MPLKTTDVTYFLAGGISLSVLLVPNVYLRIFLLVILCVWLISLKEYICIVLVLFVLIIVCAQLSYSPIVTKIEGRVVSLKDSYFVVKVKNQKIMVYSDCDVNFDDLVLVDGELKEVCSTKNRVGYSFESWANARNIRYVCDANSVEVIKAGFSLRNRTYLIIQNKDEVVSKFMKMFLFHIYDDIGWMYIGLSLGIHLSFVFKQIEGFFSYLFLEKEVSIITVLFSLFIGFFYHFDLISCRFLLRNILRLTSLNKKNRWGCLVIVLLVLFPTMITEFAFLLPVFIGFVYSFSFKRIYGISQIIVIWLQLVFNGYVSLIQIFVSRFIYPLFSCVYLICLMNIWIPFHFPFYMFSKLLEYLSKIEFMQFHVVGKPYVWMSILFIMVIIQYVITSKKKFLLYILLLFVLNHYQNYWFGFGRVVYIDVGQGDCTLLSLPFHKGNILIDTGGSVSYDVAKDVVYPVLSSYGIDGLDVVILTHDDFDHVGAFDSLSSLIDVDKVITSKNEKYVIDDFVIYDGLGNYAFEGDNENSLTCCFTMFNSSFLILGDITKAQEEVFVRKYDDLHIDYLKVAHHGSNTSTSTYLLESIKPLYALISCGDNNYYGHPNREVIERLNGYRIPYFTTKDEGMIEIVVTPIMDFMIMDKRIILNNKMR